MIDKDCDNMHLYVDTIQGGFKLLQSWYFTGQNKNCFNNDVNIQHNDLEAIEIDTNQMIFAIPNIVSHDFYKPRFNSRVETISGYINLNAKYKDDYHTLRITASDVTNHVTLKDTVFLLDNYIPYISEVVIKKNDQVGNNIYQSIWEPYNSNQLTQITLTSSNFDTRDNLYIEVTSSEPLDSLSLYIPGLDYYHQNFSPVENSNRKTWTFEIPVLKKPGTHQFFFSGRDYAGNSLLRDIESMPYRVSDTTWSVPNVNTGTDEWHTLTVSRTLAQKSELTIQFKHIRHKKINLYTQTKETPDSVKWYLDGIEISDILNFEHKFDKKNTFYEVILLGEFNDGSTASDTISIMTNKNWEE